MGLAKTIRLRMHRYLLRQALQGRKRNPKSINWKDAKWIGILFDATDLNKRQWVLAYKEKLQLQGKQVKLLGFFDNSQHDPNFTFHHFNRKQIDWALRPNSAEVKEFIEQPFDLLINVEPRTRLHSEYIAALSHARLKVGPCSRNTDSYDLMVDPADPNHLEAFVHQIESLLKKTNTRHEATQQV